MAKHHRIHNFHFKKSVLEPFHWQTSFFIGKRSKMQIMIKFQVLQDFCPPYNLKSDNLKQTEFVIAWFRSKSTSE